MDLRKLNRGALSTVLLVCCVATNAFADPTLWLVRPLYPGQEQLVDRTEKALDKLMPGDARKDAVIGMRELAAALKGRKVDDVPCFSGDARCKDPIDPFVAALGFERVVLIQGGQDEAGFKYRVVAYEPKLGKVTPAVATAANLEKALLGAVAKVVPAASTLDVKSTPAGATVFIDDVKVGVTPLTTQVLPGERVVKLDLKLHQPIEETIIIPIRGSASLDKTLEKVAARIVITASPPGTEISIDGQFIARDKVDRGILPGSHTIRLTADKHKAFEETINVKAEQQYVLDKTLEPIPGQVIVDPNRPPKETKDGTQIVKVAPPPPPPPPPTQTQLVYEKRSYFQASFAYASLTGNQLVARRWGNNGTGRTESLLTPSRMLIGGNMEYGVFGKYFGLGVVGVTYLTNGDPWQMSVGFGKGQALEVDAGITGPTAIDRVRVHLVHIAALQPQFRLAAWRFMFALQAGFEFRTGQVTGVNPADFVDQPPGATFYKDGFMPLDLLVSARLNVRFFIVEGLYMFGQGNFTQYLTGETTDTNAKSSSSWGFNAGVGYGF